MSTHKHKLSRRPRKGEIGVWVVLAVLAFIGGVLLDGLAAIAVFALGIALFCIALIRGSHTKR
jgi:hypothetical protein